MFFVRSLNFVLGVSFAKIGIGRLRFSILRNSPNHVPDGVFGRSLLLCPVTDKIIGQLRGVRVSFRVGHSWGVHAVARFYTALPQSKLKLVHRHPPVTDRLPDKPILT